MQVNLKKDSKTAGHVSEFRDLVDWFKSMVGAEKWNTIVIVKKNLIIHSKNTKEIEILSGGKK